MIHIVTVMLFLLLSSSYASFAIELGTISNPGEIRTPVDAQGNRSTKTYTASSYKEWRKGMYDEGNTSYYPFASTQNSGVLNLQWSKPMAWARVLTADIDGNGTIDVVTSNGSELDVYDKNGTKLWGTPTSANLNLIQDVDGDGSPEIFTTYRNASNYLSCDVYSSTGTIIKTISVGPYGNDSTWTLFGIKDDKMFFKVLSGYSLSLRGIISVSYSTRQQLWSYSQGLGSYGYMAIGDVNGDGILEFGSSTATTHNSSNDDNLRGIVVNENGSALFNLTINNWDPAASLDGGLEWMFVDASNSGTPQMYALEHHDSTYYPGTSHLYRIDASGTKTAEWIGPQNPTFFHYAAADTDGDTAKEIYVSAYATGIIYKLDKNLNLISQSSSGAGFLYGIVDYDGDGQKELIVYRSAGQKLVILRKDLSTVVAEYVVGSAGPGIFYFAVSDLDNDGKNELIVSTATMLYVLSPTVHGICGSANGGSFIIAPSSNLCAAGTASIVEGTGPWTWSCLGQNGGNDASCSALLQPTYALTGNVTLNGEGFTGVTFTGATCTTSDVTGAYACYVIPGWSGTITPVSGLTGFSPQSRSYANVAGNQTGQDYAVSVPFFGDGFEGALWSTTQVYGTSGAWSMVGTSIHPGGVVPHSGSKMAKFNSYSASSGSQTRLFTTSRLVIPQVVASAAVKFWMYHDTGYSYDDDRVQVQVSANAIDWVNAGNAVSRYTGATGWAQSSADLSSYIGQEIYLGFLGVSAYGNDIHLDDVTIEAEYATPLPDSFPPMTTAAPGGGIYTATQQVVLTCNDGGALAGGSIQGVPLTLTGFVTSLAGSAGASGSRDGSGTDARFNRPSGIASDGVNLFIVDRNNHTIRMIDGVTGAVTTLAGTAGVYGSMDGTGSSARFMFPNSITSDGRNLYVADKGNNTIRKIVLATGEVSTLAGSAGLSGSIDGTGASARFSGPAGITTDGTNLFVVDSYYNNNIRKIVLATGDVTTLVNGDGAQYMSDGSTFPSLTTDGTNLYMADNAQNVIKKIEIASGAVTTVAGTSWSFYNPSGIATDGSNLYVTDTGNNTIRKIVIATGAVSTLAGSAGISGSTDANGSSARFNSPNGITTDGTSLFVTDYLNNTIRKISGLTSAFTGCASTVYCLGSACTPTTPYTTAIPVSTSQTLRFSSIDNAGHSEAVKEAAYTIIRVISGTVKSTSGTALAGVVFAGSGASCSSSDANGIYSCTVAPGWSGTITPTLAGNFTTPLTRTYTNVTTNLAGQDFTAAVNGSTAATMKADVTNIYYRDGSGREINYDFSSGNISDNTITIPNSAILQRPPAEAGSTYEWSMIYDADLLLSLNTAAGVSTMQTATDGGVALGGWNIAAPSSSKWQFSTSFTNFNIGFTEQQYYGFETAAGRSDTVYPFRPWIYGTWFKGMHLGTYYDKVLVISAGINDDITGNDVWSSNDILLYGINPATATIDFKEEVQNGSTFIASYKLNGGAWIEIGRHTLASGTIPSFPDLSPYAAVEIGSDSPPEMKILTVSRSGAGSGSISVGSGTINWNGTGTASYPAGTLVTLTATAAAGSTFGGWSGCDSPNGNVCNVTMNAAKNVTATFTLIPYYTLTVTKAGSGTGSVTSTTGSLSWNGSVGTASYVSGTSVTLMELPDSLSTFGGWNGACTQSGNDCIATMTANRNVSATFNAAPRAKIASTGYDSLNAAYTAAGTGATIMLLDTILSESLLMDKGKAVNVMGGYNAAYSGRTGNPTIMNGLLTIGENDSLTVDGLAVK